MADQSEIRTELEAKLKELEARVNAVDNSLSKPGDADAEEDALSKVDDEVLNKIGSATLAELHEVRLALNRLDSGQYGICTTCGQQINPERLEALPFATTCVGCA